MFETEILAIKNDVQMAQEVRLNEAGAGDVQEDLIEICTARAASGR